jgi:hypothetical protein
MPQSKDFLQEGKTENHQQMLVIMQNLIMVFIFSG